MNQLASIAECRVQDLLAAIASTQVSPGAGAAGAVALGLAAACLSKAAIISLKHHPNNQQLRQVADKAVTIARLALTNADRDAREFAQLIRDHSHEAAIRLIDTDEALTRLCDVLIEAAENVEPQIGRNMAGDLAAARALGLAARSIHARNEKEAKDA